MTKIEAFIIGCILGAVPILFCLIVLFTVCLSAELLTDETGPYLALAALGAGVVIDVVFLKKWVKKAYQINNKLLAALYIFYSIGVLGFCMGVPILNFAAGILAGIYTARKMYHLNAGEKECNQNIKKTAVFSAVVMAMMCCLTGTWALIGGMIGSRFESPALSFTFTAPIIIAMVLTGGLILSLLQYWLTSKTAKLATRLWR